jgi:hypothetical protein
MAATSSATLTPSVLGTCDARVIDRGAARYPFQPACTCGWTWRGYVAAHAAQIMVDAHLAGEA